MKKFVVEMWGGDKAIVTEDRAEIIEKMLFSKDRPEYLAFKDVYGRSYTVKTEQIIKVKDGRSDLDIMLDNAFGGGESK